MLTKIFIHFFQLILTDFGLSKLFLSRGKKVLLQTEAGTKGFIPPEVITSSHGYRGDLADIWSAGVVLFILLVGRPPLETVTFILFLAIIAYHYSFNSDQSAHTDAALFLWIPSYVYDFINI